ncbi:class I adenylate-forming enzyme family protein [Allopusillimonas soli]|uniref:AMP-binding protein n=1 Tax=Allopusillimonas soli TaxID=659016 RepID=A0A853F502_9BURK|nr:AMP-binding protein [Allopusillimonas soli]NYT35584.1 AMP-binding protein [Allopusillimonas soli]
MHLGYLIDNAILRHGKHLAIYDDIRQLSYDELDVRSRRLANWFLAQGVVAGDAVASLQHNSLESIEVELATTRYGLVRTLLNAKARTADHVEALNLIQARGLVYGSEFEQVADRLREEVPSLAFTLRVESDHASDSAYETALRSASDAPSAANLHLATPHSVYFTSGTTGRPKGILLNHGNWIAVIRNHLVDTYSSTDRRSVVLHAAPMSHASGALVFTHLMRGAAQRVLRRFEPEAVLDAFEHDKISNVWLAPTMLIMLMEDPSFDRRDLSALRNVRYGGAPMAAERVREAVRRFGPVLCSGWGQWEAPQQCTYLSSSHIVEAIAQNRTDLLASVGQSVTFGRVGIFDDAGKALPPNTEGEVAVAGDHLMVGYIGQPKLTADLRFGPWQRTGDIGRIDHQGFVHLTDRKNDLIITGGSNVYPREVEEVLYAHPAIREAVAIGIADDKWGQTIGAIAVLRSGATLSGEALIQWCKERLPNYKRPRIVEFVSDLPKNAYGKILRRQVSEQYGPKSERGI